MDFVPLAALALLVVGVVNFLRYLRNKDWNGVSTVGLAWVAGVFAVSLVARTNFAGGIPIGDLSLADLNFASQVFVGMTIASTGSYFVDVKKALDGSDSAKVPPLIE